MGLYRKAYLAIAGVITVIGLALSPFLPYLIKDSGGIAVRELTIYYLIFLFNTVSTYFVAYKYSLSNAQQRNYIQTNIATVTKIVTVFVQIIVLLLTKNFLLYLLMQAAVELLQKIFVSIYFNRFYPYLRDRHVQKLEKEETAVVVTKTKALMFHKIGDVARLSTDSIILFHECALGGRCGKLCDDHHLCREFYQRDLQLRDLRFRQSGGYGVPGETVCHV